MPFIFGRFANDTRVFYIVSVPYTSYAFQYRRGFIGAYFACDVCAFDACACDACAFDACGVRH